MNRIDRVETGDEFVNFCSSEEVDPRCLSLLAILVSKDFFERHTEYPGNPKG
jgi:hypothetical protein